MCTIFDVYVFYLQGPSVWPIKEVKQIDITAKGIAYAISRKIGRENVQKTGFISSALNESLSILNKLPDSVVKDVKLNLQDILEKAGYYKKGETYNINVE